MDSCLCNMHAKPSDVVHESDQGLDFLGLGLFSILLSCMFQCILTVMDSDLDSIFSDSDTSGLGLSLGLDGLGLGLDGVSLGGLDYITG